MADNFQGTGRINIQRGSSNVPYRFRVTVASSSGKNDGALPWDSSMCSFSVKCFPLGSTVSSTQIVASKSLDGNEMVLRLTWTTQVRPGIYQLEFWTVASVLGSTATPLKKQLDFTRVYLKERR